MALVVTRDGIKTERQLQEEEVPEWARVHCAACGKNFDMREKGSACKCPASLIYGWSPDGSDPFNR